MSRRDVALPFRREAGGGPQPERVHRDHRAAVVRLSVDDFGTGYSSPSYLEPLSVHEVKVDRSFVTGAPRGGEDVVIVDLGRHLGLEVVAEAPRPSDADR